MKFFPVLFLLLFLCSCNKDAPVLPTESLAETAAARGIQAAEVQNVFIRLLSNAALLTLAEPAAYGQPAAQSNIDCVTTQMINTPDLPNTLEIIVDTLTPPSVPCILPNGSKMHGSVRWVLGGSNNGNSTVLSATESAPGFISLDRMYIDGYAVEEERMPGVGSPKYFVESFDSDFINLRFKVSGGDAFNYRVISPDGHETVISPAGSPKSFLRMKTSNDFDYPLTALELYNRSYELELLNDPTADPNTPGFCPFSRIEVYAPDGSLHDEYFIYTTEAFEYTPFACRFIRRGRFELREIPDGLFCPNDSQPEDFTLLMSVDFSADASTLGTNGCDSWVYVCDYSGDAANPVCEFKEYL